MLSKGLPRHFSAGMKMPFQCFPCGRAARGARTYPGIQIAPCRKYFQTLGSNVGTICILGSLAIGRSTGYMHEELGPKLFKRRHSA